MVRALGLKPPAFAINKVAARHPATRVTFFIFFSPHGKRLEN
jgi:hypothetical protein